jgi:hypothetical protein
VHRAIPRHSRRTIVAPAECGIHHDAFRDVGDAVAVVERQIGLRISDPVAEQRVAPSKTARNRLRIGIDQQLRGIEAVSFQRSVWPVDAVTIELSWSRVRQIGVPDLIRSFDEVGSPRFAPSVRRVEEAELDGSRVLGEQREIDTLSVPRGAERVRLPGPDALHLVRQPPVLPDRNSSFISKQRPCAIVATRIAKLQVSQRVDFYEGAIQTDGGRTV